MGSPTRDRAVVLGPWGVRYQVRDVERSMLFYVRTLGLTVDLQNLPAFGQVSIGGLKLILSGQGASGSRPMPEMEVGPGGKQIQLEDPDGNPIELFEPVSR